MKSALILIALTLFAASTIYAADPNDPQEYAEIIKKRCTLCHTQERIESAIREGRDMNQILIKMMQMGAQLTDQEQKVLGTFWGEALKN
jgi:cytochrome c-type biogenesis protein CcmH/NrfF